MIIETKFDKGQEVFFFRASSQLFPVLSKGTIEKAWITKDGLIYYEIKYRAGKATYTSKEEIEERLIFSTEKEARDAVNKFINSDYKEDWYEGWEEGDWKNFD